MSSGLRGYLQDSEFPPNNVSNTEKTFSSIATVEQLSMFAQLLRFTSIFYVLRMYLQGVVTDCYYSGNGHQVRACPPQATSHRHTRYSSSATEQL